MPAVMPSCAARGMSRSKILAMRPVRSRRFACATARSPRVPRLAGTAAWTTSRAAGVIAFAALTLDVVFGLFVSTGAVDRWVPRGASVDVHRWLSGVALALIGLHSVSLLVDPAIRFDALDV